MKLSANSSRRSAGSRSKVKRSGSAALKAAFLSAALLVSRAPEAAAEPLLKIESIENKGEYSVECKRVGLRAGNLEDTGCLVYPADGYSPVVQLYNPAEEIVELHPFVKKDYLESSGKCLVKVEYLLGNRKYAQTAMVGPSELEFAGMGFDVPEGMALGSPVRIDTSGAGNKPIELYIAEPSGALTFNRDGGAVLRVVPLVPVAKQDSGKNAVVADKEKPSEDAGDKAQKTAVSSAKEKEAERPSADSSEAVPKPVVSSGEEKKQAGIMEEPLVSEKAETPSSQAEKPPLVSLESERLVVSRIGEFANSGDTNEARLTVMPELTDNLSLIVGASAGLQNILASNSVGETSIRLIRGAGLAGLNFDFGKHSAFAEFFAGAAHVNPRFRSFLDGHSSEYSMVDFEAGGRAGYNYNGLAGILVEGGSSPFTVARLQIFGSLPYAWASEHLKVTLQGRLLHLLKPRATEIIGATLDQKHLLMDTTVNLPVADVGPVLPSVIAGYRWGKDLGNSREIEAGVKNIYVGAVLKAVVLDTLRLEAGGTYMFTGDYTVLLNLAYLR
ncbi:hypothetical protein GF318_00695 [Candidatus Micrarchaeota archaeon]|nr:hypothetical protein [Candidatus Micrarchaeota archaeon]